MLILAVVVAGAVVVYNFPGASPLNFRSVRGVAAVESAPQNTPEPAKKPRTGTKVTPNQGKAADLSTTISSSVTISEPPPPPQSGPEASNCCETPGYPFPTPESLKKGASSAEVISRFGTPAFDVAGTSEGRVLETYYYVSSDRTQMTVVTMQNGLLTAIDSRSSPYFQLRGLKQRIK